jgi:hypothetical protein
MLYVFQEIQRSIDTHIDQFEDIQILKWGHYGNAI